MKRGIWNLNKIIKYLIYSDLVFYTGWGLISPIFAIFILNNITNGNAFIVGVAASISLIVRSLLRVPFGIYADGSQKKSYYLMFYGLLIAALTPIGFIYSIYAWHIYILQAIFGFGIAMSSAGWTGIFAKYIDHGKESTEFGLDAVAVGVGPGIAAILGGIAVTYFSFNWVFIAVTIIGLIGVSLLLVIKSEVLKSEQKGTGKIFIHNNVKRIKARHH